MNDFTKEELQIILLDMNINIINAPPLNPAPSYVALMDKIQSLIDNYEEDKKIKDALNCIIKKAREWELEL